MKVETILKKLTNDTISELDAADTNGLKAAIIQAETSLADAKEELDNNEQYQAVKESCKAMSAGYRELKAYQTAKIQYALLRLKGTV